MADANQSAPPDQPVVAVAALDLVVAGAAVEHVVTSTTLQLHLVVAGASQHRVIAATGLQHVVSGPSVQQSGRVDVEADLALVVSTAQQYGDLSDPRRVECVIDHDGARVEIRLHLQQVLGSLGDLNLVRAVGADDLQHAAVDTHAGHEGGRGRRGRATLPTPGEPNKINLIKFPIISSKNYY